MYISFSKSMSLIGHGNAGRVPVTSTVNKVTLGIHFWLGITEKWLVECTTDNWLISIADNCLVEYTTNNWLKYIIDNR